jgi:DNA-directed RNA polymerase subunit RPC12/RpoP
VAYKLSSEEENMIEKEKSLAYRFPELAKEWHPTKNGDLTPDDVLCGTHREVWWQCTKGHEWKATVHHRTHGTNCPYCSNKKVLVGFNDLATTNPRLAKEWHPIKNGKLTPLDIVEGSNKRVWWQCEKGHEWIATVVSRTNGIGCPYCSNKKVLVGVND